MRRHSVFLRFVLLLVFVLSSRTLATTPLAGGIVTLLAHDSLHASFSFRNATFGARIGDSELLLDDAQLVFHLFVEDRLSYGFVRSEFVSVLDLGNLVVNGIEYSTDLAPKPPLSIFYTLFFDGGAFKYKGPRNRIYRLPAAQALVSEVPPPGVFHFEPQVGHTYLLKAQRRAGYGDPTPQFFKFLVIGFEPGNQVTFRWGHLR
jgi:hypothetical protein